MKRAAAQVTMSQPNWIAMLPKTFPAQLAALMGLVTVGVLIQWRLTPGRAAGAIGPPAAGPGAGAGAATGQGSNKERNP